MICKIRIMSMEKLNRTSSVKSSEWVAESQDEGLNVTCKSIQCL